MSELAFNRIILHKHNRVLSVIIMVLLVVNVILSMGLFTQMKRKPIVVSSNHGVLTTLDQKDFNLDEQVLKDFTTMVGTQYLNFHSLTLPQQIDNITKYLGLQPVESILETYKKNKDKMISDQLAHEFVIKELEITKKNDPFLVALKGERTIHARGNKKSMDVVYLFEIKKNTPTEENPYGLTVMQVIEKKKELKADNKDKQL